MELALSPRTLFFKYTEDSWSPRHRFANVRLRDRCCYYGFRFSGGVTAGLALEVVRRESEVCSQTVELLRQARSGDALAMNHLFERLFPPLHRWARGRLPGWARGMVSTVDLVQEALISTFKAIESGQASDDAAMHAYVRQALKSRLIDEIRKVQRRPATGPMEFSVEGPDHSPLEGAIGNEALARYERALESLDEGERHAVIARIELNLPYAEIAGLIEKPSPDAARMAVARALVKLAEAMGHD